MGMYTWTDIGMYSYIVFERMACGKHQRLQGYGVAKVLNDQAATIARLEAELDKLRLQMVTEVTDAEARSARLEAELERVNKYNEELFEYCEKIGGMGPGIQPPLDVVDEHRPAALSARQNGEGVGDE